MNPELIKKILDFAELISVRGIHPWRLWERNNVPTDINAQYEDLLKFWARLLQPTGPLKTGDYPVVELHNELTKNYIENETIEKIYENKTYTVIEKKDLLIQAYPEIANQFDKYGLFPVPSDVSFYFGKGSSGELTGEPYGFRYKNHILLLDNFFKRTLYKLNHFNFDLLDKLETYRQKHLGIIKVRLNRNVLGQIGTFKNYFEKDYWHGQSFDVFFLDDPNIVGFTTHYSGNEFVPGTKTYLNRTEFLWYLENPLIKTLEIEEIWGTNDAFSSNFVFRDGKYYVRFLHCRRDIQAKRFIHLDGSINIYNEQQFNQRLNTRLGRNAKIGDHIKVFQIDGDIPFEDFNDITIFFFRGNHLIQEYLTNVISFPLEP